MLYSVHELRKILTNGSYAITVQKDVFTETFAKTAEFVQFTFNGWDGKSYNGESRRGRVLTCNIPDFEGAKFVKVGYSVFIVSDKMVEEIATHEKHPCVYWVIDVK